MFSIILKDSSCFEFENREIINNSFCITLVDTNTEDIKNKFTKDNLSEIKFTTDDLVLKNYELTKITENIKENSIIVTLSKLDEKDLEIEKLKNENEELSDKIIDMTVKEYEEKDI